MTQSKNIDPLKKKNFFDGAGVDGCAREDGGYKLEIRSGKWLDAAI